MEYGLTFLFRVSVCISVAKRVQQPRGGVVVVVVGGRPGCLGSYLKNNCALFGASFHLYTQFTGRYYGYLTGYLREICSAHCRLVERFLRPPPLYVGVLLPCV